MSNNPRILILKSGPNTGGGKTYVHNILKHLRNDFELVVGCPKGDPLWKTTKGTSGVHCVNVQFEGKFDLDSYRSILQIQNQKNFDIIHGADLSAFYHLFYTSFLNPSSFEGARFVSTHHVPMDDAWNFNFISQFLANIAESKMIQGADRIITVSKYTRRYLIDKHSIDEEKIKVIYNGVNVQKFQQHSTEDVTRSPGSMNLDHDVTYGFVGRFSREKGIMYLLEAMRDLAEEDELFNLLMVGDGPLERKIKRCVHEYNLDDRTVFTGYVDEPEKIYPLIDVLIMPSFFEGFPFVAVEAQISGIPIITTPVGGMEEIVLDNKTGLIIPTRSTKPLFRAVKKLHNDPARREQFSRNAKEHAVKKFNVENMISKHRTLFNEVNNQTT